jgi:plastocyanin
MQSRSLIAALPVVVLLAAFSYSLTLGGSASAQQTTHDFSAKSTVVKVKVVANSGGLFFFFSPKKLSIKVGSSVLWTNSGGTLHTVTGNSNKFQSRNLPANGHVKITFKKVGKFKYHCIFHSSMVGQIVVHK